MENCLYSGWIEDLAECQTGLNCDSASFVARDGPSSSNSIQLAYNGFPINPNWSSEPFIFEEEDRSASASKNHSQAEKRRRDRINAHLASLRKLIPNSDKMDKATLLGTAVEQVKDLKSKALELGKVFSLPSEMDQVMVDSVHSDDSVFDQKSKGSFLIKASVCCEDRPELFSELKHGLKGLKLTTVQAHVTCLGGRIQGIFILCNEDENTKLDGIGMNKLKQSLRLVLGRIASSSTSSSTNYRIRSKRQRFFFPSQTSQNFPFC